MIRLSITYTRPNTDIYWHTDPESEVMTEKEKKLIYTEFILKLKMLHSTRVLSKDGLQLTIIGYWGTNEDIIEYQTHPLLVDMNLRRNQYYNRVQGTVGDIVKSERDKFDPADLV